nr:late secretory pathway protein avl9 [Hymenolepis microstoma]
MSSYVLVVGFHHKKGTSVEYVYPELETGLDLPPAWNFIPSIALPDGAHNFGKDYIFFTVPSLELKPTTLFGVACYRQVDARRFSNQTPDLTRNTVQKSVVFLSPTALFGAVSRLLDDVTDEFISASSCEEGYEILRNGFENIQSTLNNIVRIRSFEGELFLMPGEEILSTPTDSALSRTGATSLWSNVTRTTSSVLTPRASSIDITASTTVEQSINSNSTVHQTGSLASSQTLPSNTAPHDVYSALPPLTDGSVFDSALPTDDWGLPLALFSRSYLLLPYVPLHALDMLLEFRRPPEGDITPDPLAIGGRRVRGFLCGTTNPLLSQNTRLAEAIVHTLPFPSTEASGVAGGGDFALQMDGQSLESSGDLEMGSTDSGQRLGFSSDSHSTNRTGGVLSRLLNRHQSTIRICPPSTEPGARLRDLPVPLNRAIQLSRFDRVFIDHLVNTAELWFSAKAAKELDTGVPPAPAEAEEAATPRQLAEAEVLRKFRELRDLEKWIRDQFSVYIKSLLLTSEGRGGQLNDFNFNFVSCFRTTHNFLAWRSQYVLPSVMQQIAEEQKRLEETETAATEVVNGKTHSQPDESNDGQMRMPNATLPQPTRDIYSIGCPLIHPGRNFPSSEPTDQIVNNLKQFGNIAVDHGRRMLSGLMKLGNEKNASGGGSLLRRFASNVRSALDSVQSPIASPENLGKPSQSHEK